MPKNQTNLVSSLTDKQAINLAIQALEGWGKYANKMREIGIGTDMSAACTGFSNDCLISILKEHKKTRREQRKLLTEFNKLAK